MFDFVIFCHLLKLMEIHRAGAPSGYLKRFVLSFLFFLFFFLFYYSFCCCCLSFGGPFSSGAPGHCPPMPPSRYATGICIFRIILKFIGFISHRKKTIMTKTDLPNTHSLQKRKGFCVILYS